MTRLRATINRPNFRGSLTKHSLQSIFPNSEVTVHPKIDFMFIRFKRWHLGAAAVLPLLLTACKPHQQQKAGGWPTPTVTVNQPVQQEIVEWDEYPGRLDAVEMVEVRARVSGYLQSIHFKDGAEVKKGDLLFVIDPRQYQAELDRAEAELKQAES